MLQIFRMKSSGNLGMADSASRMDWDCQSAWNQEVSHPDDREEFVEKKRIPFAQRQNAAILGRFTRRNKRNFFDINVI